MKMQHLIVSTLYGLGLTMAVLWLLAAGPVTPVYADTFTVTTTADSGPGSLRQAILDANDNPGHDVIDFGVTGVIVLEGYLSPIYEDVTISGPGVELLAVSGDNTYPAFRIGWGTTVTITGLTVRDGYASDYGGGIASAGDLLLQNVRVLSNTAPYGGGIYVSQGSVTLNEAQVLNNDANEGGGLFIMQGAVTLSDTQVLSNTAGYGGGVYVDSSGITLIASGGEISSNTAITYGGGVYVAEGNVVLTGTQIGNNAADFGGGMYVNAGHVTLRSAQVAGNDAGLFGGGIYIAGSNVILSDTQVTGNRTGSGGGGVCLFESGATLSANNGSIDYNSATQGGGLYVGQGSATLHGTQILGNDAFNGGGGLDILYGDATLNDVQISSNSSDRAGGGVHLRYSSAVLTMNGGEISSNSAITSGGGIHVAAGHATLDGVQVLDNAADNGGGLFSAGGYVTLTYTSVASNQATGDGGGICALDGSMTLTGTQVLSNVAGSEGGGVFVWESLTAMNHTQLSNNAADSGGGGVAVYYGTVILNDSQVFSNTADYGGGVYGLSGDTFLNRTQVFSNSAGYGGGVSAHQGNVTLNGAEVFSNTAENGGGVYVIQHPSLLTVNGGEIRNNTASSSGGGVYMQQGRLALSETQVLNNDASVNGGGIYIHYGDATLTETQLLNNVTSDNGGGIFLYDDNATLTMTGGEIRHNNAREYGGGMYIDAGNATLHGTHVLSNTSTSHGGGVLVDKESAALRVSEGEINGNSANYGGGVYVNKGNVTLSRGKLDGNLADGRGGGMFIGSGNATLDEMQVFGNKAELGGGAFINLGSATFSGTQILSNVVTSNGGGVYVLQGAATLTGTQVLSNTAIHGGGLFAAYYTTTLTVNAGKIANNSASGFGGGVHVAFASATLSGTQIFDNLARVGGGLCTHHADARVRVIGGEINHNWASDVGGGVGVITGSVTLSGTQVHSNTADAQGGGVHVNYGNAMLNQVQITNNAAPDGSALYTGGTISPTSALTITGDVYQADGRFAGSAHDLRIEGALVLAGGDFYAPDEPNTLTLTGLYTHTGGTYYQTQIVDGNSDIGFPKEGGVIINATGSSLGNTQVADTAGDDCAGVIPGEAAHHCFTVTPSSIWGDITATLTLYYQDAEAQPGHDCSVMEAYAWDGTWDTMLTRDSSYGDDGRMCGSDPQSIRVIDVTEFPTITLRGPAPEIDVAPLSLDFGEQDVDAGPALSQTVTISNTGLEDLHVTGIALTGDDAADFAITGDGETVTLTTHQTHTVQITFDPASSGIKTAGLAIQSDDADEPAVTVTLSGTGTAPEISVAPPALDFGEQDVDAGPTISHQVTITNDGNVDLHITGIALSGNDASDFVIESGGEAITLTPGSTHIVMVSFDPATMGAKSALLQIQSDDSDEPTVTVTLSGAGAAAPEIVVAPLSLDFGEQDVDAGPALSQTVTIANEGSTDLHISGITLTGAGASDFVIESDTGEATLTQGSTRTVLVSFDPETAGAKSASLRIQSDDADEGTVDVALSGTGTTATSLLTVSKDGTGDGAVSSTPAGIDCGAACQAGFVAGTVVTLTATTESGFVFAGWQGEGCSGTGVCQVTMDAAKHVTATFNVAAGYPGYGSTPAPGSAIDLGTTDVGSTVSATLSIHETGDVTLVVTPTLSGADAEYFDFEPSTLAIPDGGAAQELTILCSPPITGTLAATLTVAHNAPGGPAFYPLRCAGGAVQSIYLPLVLANH